MLARRQRGASLFTGCLRAVALLGAAAALAACAGNAAAPSGPYPQFADYEGREVAEVEITGDLMISEDSIRRVVTTRPSRCRLLGLVPLCIGSFGRQEYALDLDVLSRDVVRIQLLYRDNGYYGTRVVPAVEPATDEAGDDEVNVRFSVIPGDLVTLQSLEVQGAEAIIPDSVMLRRLPLKQGEPFRRADFLASVDSVRNALLAEGHAYAQVLRNYELDTIADVARVELVANPGPLVTVDTILFIGNDRLTERTARQQITLDEGDPLRSTELARSQRNLYELELVRYATVEVAPESLQVTPDSAQLLEDSIGTTVLIRVVEAPRYAVDLSAGYGTLDCFRGQATHTDRNFLGGARRLELSGLVSKVGVASPLDAGLENSLCREFRLENQATEVDTLIAGALNYRFAADFLQPRLFGTRTSVGARGYTERISELDLYVRTAIGGNVGFIRQVAPGTVFSTTYTVERGSTQASDFFFCVAYEVCEPEDIDRLQEPRWSNNLSLGLLRSRVRLDPFPSGGHQLRLGTDLASGALGSEDRYLRVLGDGTVYRQIREGWVAQLRLSGGKFLQGVIDPGGGFIPPQRRFYAGGPTTVRGFTRNRLGPVVYIRQVDDVDEPNPDDPPGTVADTTYSFTVSPTGGTQMVVGTLEVTMPSPVFRDRMRLAAFVDAGQVWADSLESPGLRFTPGIGVRFATLVGPIRGDIAYNPYGCVPGPLYEVDEENDLRRLDDRFTPEDEKICRPSLFGLRGIAIHISLGQTF
jgi:outer membrane protein insertion porin family